MSRSNWLATSLLLNLVLVIASSALWMRQQTPQIPPSADAIEPAVSIAESDSAPAALQPVAPARTKTGDWRDWIDELRAAGVPNSVLARAVMSDLEERWQKRFEDCRGNADKMPALQLEKEKDEEAQMRAALGEEGFKQWDQTNMLREANIGKIQLTPSETDGIYDLKKKLQQRQWELEQAKLKGEMDDAELNDASAKAYSDFNQQMKTLLGDARYAQSQELDDGTAAANLRQDLAKVNPSDSQLQDLLKAQQQLNERRSELDKQFQDDPSSPAYAEQIKALDDARNQQYQSVLGTNVFDALQKEQDDGYSKMKKYESIWGLDDSKIDSVYGAIKSYEQSVADYQAQARALEAQGQNVDWDAVNKNLQQFAGQTQQSLQNYLGQDSFNKMQRNGVLQFNQ